MLTLTNKIGSFARAGEFAGSSPRGVGRGFAGTLVQAVIAIHLLPMLVVVLAVGGLGMLVLGGVRLVNGTWRAYAG